MSDSENRFYPYNKVYEGYIDLSKTTDMPKMIADYLLDMPRGNGYNPPDDNTYPRCRFWKYLYYDEEMPLEKSLPTPKQKKSVLFSTDSPTKAPTKKGYRIFPQIYIPQAQSEAQTRLYKNGVRLDLNRVRGITAEDQRYRVYGNDGSFFGLADADREEGCLRIYKNL